MCCIGMKVTSVKLRQGIVALSRVGGSLLGSISSGAKRLTRNALTALGMRRVYISITAISVLLAAIYVVLPSKGDIVILHRADIAEYQAAFRDIVRDSVSSARETETLTRTISERFHTNASFLPLAQEFIAPNRLADVLSGKLDISIKTDELNATFGVDPILLIQAYIDRFFSGDTALIVVNTFGAFPQQDGVSHYKINVDLIARGSILLGNDSPMARADMVRQLAAFFISQIYEADIDCTRTLCARELVALGDDLNTFVESLDSLRYGRSVGVCREISIPATCLSEVRVSLNRISSRHQGSAMADFGLLLVELSDLKRLITEGGSSDEIASSLESAYTRLIQAQAGSPYFAAMFGSEDRIQQFLNSSGLDQLGLSASFLKTFPSFMAGRDYLQKGGPRPSVEEL